MNPMTCVVIVVRPFVAEAVLGACAEFGVSAGVVREAKGYGRQKGYLDRYRGSEFSTDIDGTDLHLLHVRSPEPEARSLVLVQDWPDSNMALLDVLGPLSDPRSFGADPSVAFHLIVPSLPGCGFSGTSSIAR